MQSHQHEEDHPCIFHGEDGKNGMAAFASTVNAMQQEDKL
jgi:hypothetical protein